MCRGGGQVVSVLALSSDDLSLNPAETYSFFPLKFENQNNKKRPGMANIKKMSVFPVSSFDKKIQIMPIRIKITNNFCIY